MHQLILPEALRAEAHKLLFAEHEERFGFFYCGWAKHEGHYRLVANKFIPVPSEKVESDYTSPRMIDLDFLLGVLNTARPTQYAVVEAHTHPGSGDAVSFSRTDTSEIPGFAAYVQSSLPNRPYGATVWGERSVEGLVFDTIQEEPSTLEVVGVGDHISLLQPKHMQTRSTSSRFHRQELAFGQGGQQVLGSLRVGIVGLGGIGCHVALQLAYLGVRSFVLVDSDKVEDTNLNRLLGATSRDLGRSKVSVFEARIKEIANPAGVDVMAIKDGLRTTEALSGLARCHVLFGCVDNDGARLILNELSLAYGLPLFDLATGIDSDEGGIRQAGGRAVFVSPGRPWVQSLGEIDAGEARDALASEQERAASRRLGYIRDLPNPAVISLNGAIASIGVTEFLAWSTRFRAPNHYVTYYALDPGERVTAKRANQPNPNCLTCGYAGIGAKVGLERYLLGQQNHVEPARHP